MDLGFVFSNICVLLFVVLFTGGDEASCPCPAIPPKNLTKTPPKECFKINAKYRYSCIEGYVRRVGTSGLTRCQQTTDGAAKWSISSLECIRDPKLPPIIITTTTTTIRTTTKEPVKSDSTIPQLTSIKKPETSDPKLPPVITTTTTTTKEPVKSDSTIPQLTSIKKPETTFSQGCRRGAAFARCARGSRFGVGGRFWCGADPVGVRHGCNRDPIGVHRGSNRDPIRVQRGCRIGWSPYVQLQSSSLPSSLFLERPGQQHKPTSQLQTDLPMQQLLPSPLFHWCLSVLPWWLESCSIEGCLGRVSRCKQKRK
ncbi:uncharacterized protein KZ484_020060 isoform 1-T1 [Pholidichthys leucotaenia]